MMRPDSVTPNDAEGDALPRETEGIPILDAHVHLFPDRVFDAIFRWFDTNAWPIRYKLHSDAMLDHLESRGVREVVALHYAHKPGMAQSLNEYVLGIARRRPGVIPTATVYPGEPGAREILRRAFGEGARGVKLHCHVQRMAPDDERLDEVYQEATRARVPVVIHAGREPSSDAYGIDCHALCAASRMENVLRRHPDLLLIVPHLGSDEFAEYEAMLDRHPNLHLDTTMVMAEYFPIAPDAGFLARRADRLLYGTDFPNIPYAWDRELRRIAAAGLSRESLGKILGGNARRLFGVRSPS